MTGNSEQSSQPTDIDCGADTETSTVVTSSSPSLSTTMVHSVLANRRRRDALRYLKENETPIALADLADEIAARETEQSIPEIPAAEVKRVHTSLWHNHIPKLDDSGIVECDRDTGAVTVIEIDEQIEAYLEQSSTE